jgi:hypothetical protein
MAPRLTVGHQCPGLPEPGRWASSPMTYDPDIEQFFRELKSAKATSEKAAATPLFTPSVPKRITILPKPEGDVVARHAESRRVLGEFTRVATGEIYFQYVGDARRWYVNKTLSAFSEAANIFNRCCELHVDDEDTADLVAPALWAAIVAQLRSEFERIEPLGDSESSLWSATLNDSEYA